MKDHQLFHITCKGLIFYKNRFLLHRANNPEYFGALECPGGRVDTGETLEDVLKRELFEEIGLDLNNVEHKIELFSINQRDAEEYGWDNTTQIIEVYYKVRIPDDIDLKIKTLDEVSSFEWINKNTNLDNFPYLVISRKAVYKKAQETLI
jgi:8-oxo-dGTP pyrophosphatase MutT (NUDIX family)